MEEQPANATVDDAIRKRKRLSKDSDDEVDNNYDVAADNNAVDVPMDIQDEESAAVVAAKCGIDKNYIELMNKDVEKRVVNGETAELLKKTEKMIVEECTAAVAAAVASSTASASSSTSLSAGIGIGVGVNADANVNVVIDVNVVGAAVTTNKNELDELDKLDNNKCMSISGNKAVQMNNIEPNTATTSNKAVTNDATTTATTSCCELFIQIEKPATMQNSIRHMIRRNTRNRSRFYRRRTLDSSSSSSTTSPERVLPADATSTGTTTTTTATTATTTTTTERIQQAISNVNENMETANDNDVSNANALPQNIADAPNNMSDSNDIEDDNPTVVLRSLQAVNSILQRRLVARRASQHDRSHSDNSSPYSDDDDNDADDDDDDDLLDDIDIPAQQKTDKDALLREVLNKKKPAYSWSSVNELMRREHGLDFDGRCSFQPTMSRSFNTRFYSSLHVIERMKLTDQLRKHNGCVNCVNFNRDGNLLCSGSDDTRIIVWDWAGKKPLHVYKSGHSGNIFQTKFVNANGFLDIISSSRDGQVRRSIIPPSGGKPQVSILHKHRGGAHKLVISPNHASEVYSAGEDAYVRRKDLRCDEPSTEFIKVMTKGERMHKVSLYSIAHNPFAPELCVAGSDNSVRVYDKRNPNKVLHEMCPEHLVALNSLATMPQVTCAVYNYSGSEILASYSDDHIYLFDNKNYKPGKFLHQYRGHYNHRTIKGVNFFGPRSEYIISGSDCGHIFYWDKNTEAIVNFMPGDNMGVVNCLEPHPSIPVLATSGLDNNIKIWTPSSETFPPDLTKLEDCLKRNLSRSVMGDSNLFDDRQFQYFIRQFLHGPRPRRSASGEQNEGDLSSSTPNSHLLSSSSSSSSLDSEDDDDDDDDDINYPYLEGIHCRTQ